MATIRGLSLPPATIDFVQNNNNITSVNGKLVGCFGLKVKENFDDANANFRKLHGTKIRYKNRQHF